MVRKRAWRTWSHRSSKAWLDALIEEATVDCYNEEEQASGLFTMIEENLDVAFETMILGVPATVVKVDLTDESEVVALCRRGREKQVLPLLNLPLPSPPPAGFEWIEAYRHWRRSGV